MSDDGLGIIEAGYAIDVEEQAWLLEIAERVRRQFPGSSGFAAIVKTAGGPEVENVAFAGASPERVAAGLAMESANRNLLVEVAGRGAVTAVTDSKTPIEDTPGWAACVATGMRDLFVSALPDSSGHSVAVTAALPAIHRLRQAERMQWNRIALHLTTAFRLRRRIGTSREIERNAERKVTASVDAVLTPRGKVEHAENAAKGSVQREALRRAAIAIDTARGKLRRKDPRAAVELWTALTDGTWSLVDRFETDGKRYLIARRNEVVIENPKGLPPIDRQILTLRAQGRSLKLIAYELGVPLSTVEYRLKRGMRQVGVSTIAELSALVGCDAGGPWKID